jgi:hypothetical protein
MPLKEVIIRAKQSYKNPLSKANINRAETLIHLYFLDTFEIVFRLILGV